MVREKFSLRNRLNKNKKDSPTAFSLDREDYTKKTKGKMVNADANKFDLDLSKVNTMNPKSNIQLLKEKPRNRMGDNSDNEEGNTPRSKASVINRLILPGSNSRK